MVCSFSLLSCEQCKQSSSRSGSKYKVEAKGEASFDKRVIKSYSIQSAFYANKIVKRLEGRQRGKRRRRHRGVRGGGRGG